MHLTLNPLIKNKTKALMECNFFNALIMAGMATKQMVIQKVSFNCTNKHFIIPCKYLYFSFNCKLLFFND